MKKIFGWLHLWLGLVSGIVVFIISITGAIYAWQPEISEFTQPYRFVTVENKPYKPVTDIRAAAEQAMNGKKAFRILYEEAGKAPVVQFYQKEPYYYFNVYVNPYTGKVQKVLDRKDEFFSFIIEGHMYLWLPKDLGHVVVSYGTLIFLVMLVTGIVLWWPRNKARRKTSYRIKWDASPKRLNYDLHNVLGFYASWIVLFAALTGLVWSFQWVAQAEFWVFSGGKTRPAAIVVKSDRNTPIKDSTAINRVFTEFMKMYPDAAAHTLSLPANDSAAIHARAYPNRQWFHDADHRYFDQYTGKEIPASYLGKYADASLAEKVVRMNYDIHVGGIAGLPGRIAMFFAALISASLPVTGFMVWWGRKKKKKPVNNKVPVAKRMTAQVKADA
ncbi:PepSY domain-containing protein [Chitinophaga horti]|uniref:PepSY domain-containing protein n=1 Tax=Chitinophaga horti TaxID=2920382 RepID=A0ABY6IVS6_9BACT|nr:PepSY-associated TM helix domain-containing protein [Chitinophaga horti]UYQ91333.1 PepSY domain-containing protein [Chitinophaga horti]